jgi:type IV pilus assembly protein PilQ
MKIKPEVFLTLACAFLTIALAYGQETEKNLTKDMAEPQIDEEGSSIERDLRAAQNVTLDFKDADIRNVLKIISYKAGVNIVTTPEVMGNVTIRLVDVPWENALDAIVKTYGFGYDKRDNIITVAPIDKLTAQKKQEVELAQVQPTVTEVFSLKYIDAMDAKKTLDSQISPRGKITILETTGQAGWEFGYEELGKRKRVIEGRISRSKTLVISDIPPVLDKIREIIQKIDVLPQQILIEAKLVEVSHNKLREIGFNWGSGTGGPVSLITHRDLVNVYPSATNTETGEVQQPYKSVDVLPSIPLNRSATKTLGSQFLPNINVAELIFQKLTGTEFEVVLQVLETMGDANILSAPHILTLNNQEASILVGQKYPLLKSTISTETGALTGSTLDKYQDIGIQLNVVPQISGNDTVNLIIHPAVTSFTDTVDAVSSTGQRMASYPIILTREADTQILIKDGETVVIGGLMTDSKNLEITGIPFLKDIPILGLFFQKRSTTLDKLDLLIFITARIIKQGELVSELVKTDKGQDKGLKETVTKNRK